MPETYPAASWYTATSKPLPPFAPLDGDTKADVAIVGGGYTGLSAALHLAEAGLDVVLLEQHRVGWGASGRNGGQVHSGQRRDVEWLEERVGFDETRRLWGLAEEAKTLVHDLAARHDIDYQFRPGLLHALHKPRFVDEDKRHVATLKERYGYDQIDSLDRDGMTHALGTSIYHGGSRDRGAGHLHPLNFAMGLARAAAEAGARIHEGTTVSGLTNGVAPGLVTDRGHVRAETVVLAGNGHLERVDRHTEARVMPINNFILVTEPIGAGHPGGILPGGDAAADSRFVVHYWRPTPDGRLLFGGGETYTRRFPADIHSFVGRYLGRIYPHLHGAKIDHAWGGTLAVTVNRLPFIRRVKSGVYAACGYSGQGVALAPFAGKVLAEAITGSPAKLDAFAALPCPAWPGGRYLRGPALVAGMLWYALRDRL